MLIIKILLVLLGILFLLLLMILLIPFVYQIKVISLNEKSLRFNTFWFFGLLGFSGTYVLYQGFEMKINVFGLKIKVNTKDKVKKDSIKKIKKKKKKTRNKKKKAFSFSAIKPLLLSVKKVLFHFMPDGIEGYGRLGFFDPYYTGMACSIIEALRGLHYHNLKLNYVFEEEVYEGEIYIHGKIYIVYIAYIAIRLLLNKSARKLIFN